VVRHRSDRFGPIQQFQGAMRLVCAEIGLSHLPAGVTAFWDFELRDDFFGLAICADLGF
jgi:hypothetical protein